MNKLKVIKVSSDAIEFDNGVILSSSHRQNCCESHELTMSDLTLADFDGLEFDLSNDDFFKRVPDFGIELIPISGHPVRIPGHGYNNGYYGTNLSLDLDGPGFSRSYDITDCQVIQG